MEESRYMEFLGVIKEAILNYVCGGRDWLKCMVLIPLDELKCLPLADDLALINETETKQNENKSKILATVIVLQDHNSKGLFLVRNGTIENIDYLEFLADCVLSGEIQGVQETCDAIREAIQKQKQLENDLPRI